MPDRLFADRRLAAVYDPLDPDRSDLDAYAALATELGARTVLDLGCGTGTFAVLLAARGFDVTGVDPAAASIDVARAKPGADRVRWVVGEIDAVADLRFDLVTMTGNVAQVFVTDEAWRAMLATAHDVVRPGGHLVFETRDPAREAWREWTREESFTVADTPGEGRVESWVEVTDVRDELVTFRSTLVFTDATITSESTLRFRSRDAVTADLVAAGFVVEDVREAPDRPGREMVFVASRPDESLARNKERGWRELGVIDEALLRGEIDEDGWHARVLDIIEPAYLAAETPQGQSGSQRRRRRVGARAAAAARRGARRQRRAGRRLRQRAADGVAGGVGRRGRRRSSSRTASRSPPGSPTWRARGCRTGPTASGPATR